MISADTIGAYLEPGGHDGDIPPGIGRIQHLLGSPLTWAEPPPGLRERVFAAIRAGPTGRPPLPYSR
jgi:hypothetical protein